MKKYCFFLFLIASVCLYGQEIAFPKIVPPSPTAYELGKYGQVPVGMFTGTPNVSLPLYTYNTQNLSVPISLTYSSNGIKVDQLASNVGLGWSLNAGGVITRIVRDKADEERGVLIPEKKLQELGYSSPEAMAFFQSAGEDDADTETDLYMYNFMGHSGKFIFNNKEKDSIGIKRGIIMMPQTDVKVDIHSNGFKITTPDGIIYFFQEQEITRSRTYGAGHSLPEIPAVTAWYLTKIEHPKGDNIEFIYDSAGSSYVYDANVSEGVRRLVPHIQQGCDGTVFGDQYSPETITNKVWVTAKRLSKIKSNTVENGEILIESNVSHPEISSYKMISRITVKDKSLSVKEKIDLSYYPTQNDRILLNGVQFLDSSKNYSFDYYNPDEMPARLSKGVDYFGYFNGKNNSHRFPNPQDPFIKPYINSALWDIPDGADKTIDPIKALNGLLKKVHYPTKGYNEFEYESNSYVGDVTHYPSTQHLTLQAISNDIEMFDEDELTTPQIGFTQEVDVIIFVGPTPCNDGTHPAKAHVTIKDDLNNTIYSSLEEAGSHQHSFTFVENRAYTLKIKSMRWCVQADLNLYYKPGNITVTTEKINTGGLRIKRINSFDTPTSINPNNIIRYYYGKKETPEISSGLEGPRPYYVTKSTNRERSGCFPGDYRDITSQSLNSNSMRQLYSSSNVGSTFYKYITVSYGGDNFEGGGIENEYYIMPDVQGTPLRGDPIEGSPWVNTGWKNGLLKKETVFKKTTTGDIVLLKETTNSYTEDPNLFQQVFGYSVLRKFDSSGQNVNKTCTQADVDWVYEYKVCVADHKHQTWIPTGNCIAWGHDNRTRRLYDPCHGWYEGKVITFPDRIENLDVMEYSSNSYWFYLDSSIVKQYDDNGNFTQTATNYYYDNPQHLQQTRVEKTTSIDNKKLIIQTDYADDLSIQPLIDDYRIAEPVQIRKYIKEGTNQEELLSTQRTVYDHFGGLYLPKAVQTAKGGGPLQERLVYSSYDGYGNLREVSRPDGAKTVYVMGYDFTLPVAKLENVSLSEINQSWLTPIYNATNDSALVTALTNLRTNITNLNKTALVTTLTYKPLVGVHTVTDPKGYKMIYEYDDFGRLQYVKDMDNNVLSENQYHYIND